MFILNSWQHMYAPVNCVEPQTQSDWFFMDHKHESSLTYTSIKVPLQKIVFSNFNNRDNETKALSK